MSASEISWSSTFVLLRIASQLRHEVKISPVFLWHIFVNFMEEKALYKTLWRFGQTLRSDKVTKHSIRRK